MEPNSEVNINIENTRIIEIRHVKLNFDSHNIRGLEGSEVSLAIRVDQSIGVGKIEKTVGVRSSINIINAENKDNEVEYINEIVFEIDYFNDAVKIDDKKLVVDLNLKRFLYAVCLSTSRGLLFEKLSGTPYSQVYLPILEPQLASITE